MCAHVLVLGAGFGGLELTASLAERFGDDIEITLIDQNEHFVFGFSKLDVMFGKQTAEEVSHPYSRLCKPGVDFVRATILSIAPDTKQVVTDAGTYTGDYLVVALGADLDPAATPGLLEAGHEYYTNSGAFAVREVLDKFDGGRVVVGVASTPFKCPPAPSETALLLHEYLRARGLRERSEIALVMPLPTPVPPVPAASDALIAAFAERGIEWHPHRTISRLDPEKKELVFADDSTMAFDLFLGVPKHVVPPVVAASGMAVDGWIPVNALTLETTYSDVFAIGDVTSVGTAKAGVFSEGQAVVVADLIAARITSTDGSLNYDGNGICYVEFGSGSVARVDVTFAGGKPPFGSFETATEAISAEKDEFGASRLSRWIGNA
ncbi:NAD(P)/FAD-dependent oxidoreductase [Arthrobacter sp.]|uniref:NAD(P)/FAD-dependent oxidoreductase n=1 Tax=Arthrobacter sp. TaxID=1667 RepID=UPI0026DF711F|nr:FAD/NAD(P)-binding oxidoreductase [Arthrobacter sp.]MDO5752054.1 FAD/NAD(P)-binding oxidoreductase [Arthrobacter sp.]